MRAFAMAALLLTASPAFSDNLTSLQCSDGSSGAYALTWKADTQELRVWLFDQADYGIFPQVDSSNGEFAAFSKGPESTINGIPIRFEISISVTAAPVGTRSLVKVQVSHDYPHPISEGGHYTDYLDCTKVSEFSF